MSASYRFPFASSLKSGVTVSLAILNLAELNLHPRPFPRYNLFLCRKGTLISQSTNLGPTIWPNILNKCLVFYSYHVIWPSKLIWRNVFLDCSWAKHLRRIWFWPIRSITRKEHVIHITGVHNVLHCGQKRAEPRSDSEATCSDKWSKNFEERPHRTLDTPRGSEWIRPTLTPSNTRFFGPKQHLDRFSRFCVQFSKKLNAFTGAYNPKNYPLFLVDISSESVNIKMAVLLSCRNLPSTWCNS